MLIDEVPTEIVVETVCFFTCDAFRLSTASKQSQPMPNDRDVAWVRSNVIDLSPSMNPPQFMLPEGKILYDSEDRKSVIQEQYDWAVGILNKSGGYRSLVTIGRRLRNHIPKADERISQYKSRRNYARIRSDRVKSKVSSIIEDRAQENLQNENLQDLTLAKANQKRGEYKSEVLDEPVGEHWKRKDGTVELIPITEEWSVTTPGVNPLERKRENVPLSNLSVSFTPDPEDCNTEIDEDHLRSVDEQGFNGEETWREVIELLSERWKSLEESLKKARQTANFLSFRLSVVKTVLYRFEVFGDTSPMSDEAAQAAANGEPSQIFENRSTLLSHAEKIVHKYQDDPTSLPETMSQFQGWLGPNGESMVTQLQRAIHEAGLSKRYEDGNPESFCELVEALVNRHYTN
jgi:hypothetical protein